MAGILSIPIEIQQEIAINMETKTMLAFRLTNLQLSQAIHDVFLHRCFGMIRFLSTTTSLSRFSQICRNPRLRPKLHDITFCFLQLRDVLSDEVREQFLPGAAVKWIADGLYFLKKAGITPTISVKTFKVKETQPFRPKEGIVGAGDLIERLEETHIAPGWAKRFWPVDRNPGVSVLIEAMNVNNFPIGDLRLEE